MSTEPGCAPRAVCEPHPVDLETRAVCSTVVPVRCSSPAPVLPLAPGQTEPDLVPENECDNIDEKLPSVPADADDDNERLTLNIERKLDSLKKFNARNLTTAESVPLTSLMPEVIPGGDMENNSRKKLKNQSILQKMPVPLMSGMIPPLLSGKERRKQ